MRRSPELLRGLAAIAGALLWIEHGHRIDIETRAGAAFAAPAVAVCPDNENVPYSADCIMFMQGSVVTNHWRAKAAVSPNVPVQTNLRGPACPPNNENIPYSADCIKFMSGWFWRAN
jgi:hypothetical protein